MKKRPFWLLIQWGVILAGVVAAVFLLLGYVDLRTDAQKERDAREALLSQVSFQCGVEAIERAEAAGKCRAESIRSVRYLKGVKKYVLITYRDAGGAEQELCYCGSEKKFYDARVYHHAYANSVAFDNYAGQEQEHEVVFRGKDLEIMLEEVE